MLCFKDRLENLNILLLSIYLIYRMMENIFLGSSTEWKEELAKKVFHKIRIRIKGMFNGVSEVNQG